MGQPRIDVIATTISGSIKDGSKIERIVPLFQQHGRDDVALHVVDSHEAVRNLTPELIAQGSRVLISAGGSGTFNRVIEGCIDSGVGLGNITVGFLRKGSADLIGKALGMPDQVDEAVAVFANSLAAGSTVKCDVIRVTTEGEDEPPRHFVGYSGAGIFGRVPRYTENRFIKFYKGVLGQLFGDMGPFFVGATLATTEEAVKRLGRGETRWLISVDGQVVSRASYQAMIIVNGDLGPDLPFARSAPLGSGDFHLFALRDIGLTKLPGQFRHAWDTSITKEPERWGFESYTVHRELVLSPEAERAFPVNVDGSTMLCRRSVSFAVVDQVNLICRS